MIKRKAPDAPIKAKRHRRRLRMYKQREVGLLDAELNLTSSRLVTVDLEVDGQAIWLWYDQTTTGWAANCTEPEVFFVDEVPRTSGDTADLFVRLDVGWYRTARLAHESLGAQASDWSEFEDEFDERWRNGDFDPSSDTHEQDWFEGDMTFGSVVNGKFRPRFRGTVEEYAETDDE